VSKEYNKFKKEYCTVCGSSQNLDAHHVKSQKARPDLINAESNVLTLCRKHHSEIHTIGLNSFIAKYMVVYIWLKNNGWQYDDFSGKWYL
jgi:hypothetical protein